MFRFTGTRPVLHLNILVGFSSTSFLGLSDQLDTIADPYVLTCECYFVPGVPISSLVKRCRLVSALQGISLTAAITLSQTATITLGLWRAWSLSDMFVFPY